MHRKLLQLLTITIMVALLNCCFASEVKAEERLYYIHSDHLGSTTLVTDEYGEPVSQQSYYPYGETRYKVPAGALPTERAYIGQVSDQNQTGLYYYNARYYNPQIALFTQADIKEGSNRYVYSNNNPLRFIDMDGLQACEGINNGFMRSICKKAESLLEPILTSDESYEIVQTINERIFEVKDVEDTSRADLLRYKLVYQAVAVAGGKFLYNQPWSSKFMNHYLWGNGEYIDISEELQEYVNNNSKKYWEGLTKGDEHFYSLGYRKKIRETGGGYKVPGGAGQTPFLDTPETTGDTITAMGGFSTYVNGEVVRKGYEKGMYGIYIKNPQISVYDTYDWDVNLNMAFTLPILGAVNINDNIGEVLAAYRWATPFDVEGNAVLKGIYFLPISYSQNINRDIHRKTYIAK